MNVNLRFKTATFLLLLLSTCIFLIFFMINAFYDSKKIIAKQADTHNKVMIRRYEEGLRSYLDNVEENFLTIRSNYRMIESFQDGNEENFLAKLSEWEEDFEKVHYDFVAVSFLNNKCFLFSGYFTKLKKLSCADLFIKSGNMDNYGWQAVEVDKNVLGLYTTTLNIQQTGKVIGQLIGGVKLSDNRYLLEKLTLADQEDVQSIEILFNGDAINSLTYSEKKPLSWISRIFSADGPRFILSQGKIALGSNLLIRLTPNDNAAQSLQDQLIRSILYGCAMALITSMLVSFTISQSVDRQLQSLISFARKAHVNKRTAWRKTNIVDFNEIGEEIVEIMKDLKNKEELLLAANINLTDINSEKRQILHHLIKSEENERLRLSNNLHDNMSQILAAVRLNLTFLRDDLNKANFSTVSIQKNLDLINAMYDTVYAQIMSLRPFEMNDFGLNVSLTKIQILQRLEEMDYAILFDIEQKKNINDEVMSNLYRIAQEALSNIMKHAHGTYILIKLVDEIGGLRLVIEDDGIGLPLGNKADQRKGGFGLMSIRERAEYLNANLQIGPGEDDEGVSINVFVPAEHAYNMAA